MAADGMHFTRRFGDTFGRHVEDHYLGLLGSPHIMEAFSAMAAQVDFLVDGAGLDMRGAAYVEPRSWVPEDVLDSADECAMIAREQNNPSWVALSCLAGAMRAMILTAPLAPSRDWTESDNRVREAALLPPGVAVAVSGAHGPAAMIAGVLTASLGREEYGGVG